MTTPRSNTHAAAARRWSVVFLAAMVAVGIITWHFFNVPAVVDALRDWAWQLGKLAPALYALVYLGATLLGVPATPLVVVAALLFGPLPALLAMASASTLSAVVAFLLARSTAREALETRLRHSAAYTRLCRLVERYDALVIPFVRLAPVLPFAVVNYGLGITGIGFWRYALWSALAIVASDSILVFGTDALYDVLTRGALPWPVLGSLALALVAGLALAVLARRRSLPGRNYRWKAESRPDQWEHREAGS